MGLETLAFVALGLGAVGQGISFFGQQEAAKTSATFQTLNAQAQLAQNQMQSRLATAQASLQQVNAANAQRAGEVNAAALRSEAETRDRATRINIERQAQDQERFNSMLLARAGKSGTLTDTASPLDALVYSAELENQELAEMAYQNELQRSALYRQAQAEELGADRAGIQGELYGIEGAARASAFKAQGVRAQIQGIAGVQAANAARTGAFGGLLGGIGDTMFRGAQALRWLPGGDTSI